MLKRFIMVMLIFSLLLAACETGVNKETKETNSSVIDPNSIEGKLLDVKSPSMDIGILSGNEDQLFAFLVSLSTFEIETLRVPRSDFNEKERKLIQKHLENVYSEEMTSLMISGFFRYDAEKKIYSLNDIDWFTVNDRWTSTSVEIESKSESAAIIVLTGNDDYSGDNRTLKYHFVIRDGKLKLVNIDYQ